MRLPLPEVIEPPERLGHVHLVGIGGAGLSGIARLLVQRGVPVSGSDASESATVRALRSEGIDCVVGHDAAHLVGAQTVIVSTAVREDNPEVIAARARGLRLWPRAAGLRSAMSGRRVAAVAGTHGKTTTTAMLTCALAAAGADPSYAIGADVPSLGSNARWAGGDILVAEADESDGAFLAYAPELAVVTNVDADHLDVWGSPEAYAAAFTDFVGTLGRTVVLNADDPGAMALAGPARTRGLRVVTAGVDAEADLVASDLAVTTGGTGFVARGLGADAQVQLTVPGRHYAQDALLALAAGIELGHDPAGLARGLGDYAGAARRMEHVGDAGGVRIYDSYAHHPAEIVADVAAARSLAGEDRLVVAYQPHLVSRTRVFGRAMGEALSAADRVLVADIYLAREEPDPTVDARLVVDGVDGPPATAAGGVAELAEALIGELRPGDLLLTLGAGDITTVGPRVLRELARDQPVLDRPTHDGPVHDGPAQHRPAQHRPAQHRPAQRDLSDPPPRERGRP